MNQAELKSAFNQAISNAKSAGIDGATIAKMELLREWHSNEGFAQKLADHVAPITENMAMRQA